MIEMPDASAALLRDIAAWCERSGQSEGDLGRMVLNHPGFTPLLRKRGTLAPATERRFRQFMERFPDGCDLVEGRAEAQRMHVLRSVATPAKLAAPYPSLRRVRDDHGSLSGQIETEAARLGCAMDDMLGRLVALGWQAYREMGRS